MKKEDIQKEIKTVKVLIVGDRGVGKTLLLQRYFDNTFDTSYAQNVEGLRVRTKEVTIDGTKVNLEVFDLNPVQYRGYIPLPDYHGVIVTFSIADKISFQNAIRLSAQYESDSRSQPIKTKIALVGTLCDLPQKEVYDGEAEAVAQQLDAIYVGTSAKNNIGIDALFNTLVHEILVREAQEAAAKTRARLLTLLSKVFTDKDIAPLKSVSPPLTDNELLAKIKVIADSKIKESQKGGILSFLSAKPDPKVIDKCEELKKANNLQAAIQILEKPPAQGMAPGSP